MTNIQEINIFFQRIKHLLRISKMIRDEQRMVEIGLINEASIMEA